MGTLRIADILLYFLYRYVSEFFMLKTKTKSCYRTEFVPRDVPLMTFMEAFELVMVKYKDAFKYLASH